MYVQVEFLEKIPCSGCRRPLIRDGTVIEPVATRSGAPYAFDENAPPKSITLALRCPTCGAETQFLRNGANTWVHRQPNPPSTITPWSPYVVAET
jgi:hypothetical protein